MDSRFRSAASAASAACALITLILIASSTVAECCGANSTKRPVEERVIELPEDGDMWHFSVAAGGDAASQRVLQFCNEAPRLAHLKTQTKFHPLKAGDWWVKDHLAGETLPVVVLQTETGKVIYKRSGTNIPKGPEELADEMESAIWAHVADCGPDGCQPTESRPRSRIPETRKKDSFLDSINIEVIALIAVAIFAGIAAVRGGGIQRN